MPDTLDNRVNLIYLLLLTNFNEVTNYSRNSIMLAYLYRPLDHDIDFNQENVGGCMILLQAWAWDHMHFYSNSVIH